MSWSCWVMRHLLSFLLGFLARRLNASENVRAIEHVEASDQPRYAGPMNAAQECLRASAWSGSPSVIVAPLPFRASELNEHLDTVMDRHVVGRNGRAFDFSQTVLADQAVGRGAKSGQDGVNPEAGLLDHVARFNFVVQSRLGLKLDAPAHMPVLDGFADAL